MGFAGDLCEICFAGEIVEEADAIVPELLLLRFVGDPVELDQCVLVVFELCAFEGVVEGSCVGDISCSAKGAAAESNGIILLLGRRMQCQQGKENKQANEKPGMVSLGDQLLINV